MPSSAERGNTPNIPNNLSLEKARQIISQEPPPTDQIEKDLEAQLTRLKIRPPRRIRNRITQRIQRQIGIIGS